MNLKQFALGAALAAMLAVLAGCAGNAAPPPGGYGVCAEQPGSYACQIDRYQNAA
ncbi:hypothetical protein [Variovorax sp.]|uniref:hypothetical protein n=1 Tax=Variovorax sp. TaxID=1871043 RepID=UPI002D57E76A|nr:hypothetical protein [Variovorax sp.]HYP83529.1 hypothetical protein [Variovorax sp.]